jgi:hypothetical protein
VTFDRGRWRCSAADLVEKISQGGAPGRGGEFRRRGRGPGLPAAANSSGTLAGVVYSDDESRRLGGANWRG